jgi:hypothetical protein
MSTLGLDASHIIIIIVPFVQAISGCDKTSPMLGMDQPLFKILNEIPLREHAMMFMKPNASQDEIVKSGEEVIASLYGGIIYEGLDFLRYRKFTRKLGFCKSILAPTSIAASYHGKHAYFHHQEWAETTDHHNLLEWGWENVDGKLFPTRTNLSPTPERLFKVIRCSCKLNCRKHGLYCTVGYGDCKGVSFSNSNLKNIKKDADMTEDL